MNGKFLRSRHVEGEAFDMTPVIDVVFLLIIFFMLVCQFIVAERFRVEVPDEIASAVPPKSAERPLTVTVLPDGDGTLYAIGNERLDIDNAEDIAPLYAAAIDDYFQTHPAITNRVVRLRCDKSVAFGCVRPVLKGIAQSSATTVDWAARHE